MASHTNEGHPAINIRYHSHLQGQLWHGNHVLQNCSIRHPENICKPPYQGKEIYELNITNARITKISDFPKHLFGVKLSGYKNTVMLYGKSIEEQTKLFDALKFYCLQHYLANDFSIKGLIGRGNFSKVHLGCKLGANMKFAIKSIEKQKILQSMHSMVFI
jgi:hypothetical protein